MFHMISLFYFFYACMSDNILKWHRRRDSMLTKLLLYGQRIDLVSSIKTTKLFGGYC